MLRDGALIIREALTRRASLRTEALSGPLRDEPPYGRRCFRDPYGTSLALTDELPYTNGTSPSRAGGAYGTRAYGGAYGTSVLTRRAGGAYGTSLFTGRNYEPLYGTAAYRATPAGSEGVTGPASLRDQPLLRDDPLRDEIASLQTGGAYKTSLLTGRRRLRDHAPAALTGRASLQDGGAGTSLVTGRTDAEGVAGLASLHNGGTDGTSLLTGRRRLRDEPVYGTEGPDGPELPTSFCKCNAPFTGGGLWDERVRGAQGRLLTGWRRLRDEPPDGPEAEAYGTSPSGRALRTGGGYGTSLLTGRRRLRGTSLLLARRHSQTSLRTEALLCGRRRLRDASLRGGSAYGTLRAGDAYGTSLFTRRRRRLTGRASLRDGGAGRLLTGKKRRRLRDQPPCADYGRRLRDEPPYGPEALTGRASLRTEVLTSLLIYVRGGTHRRASSLSPAPGAYGTSLLTEALTGRASLRAGGAYGTSLFTGRNYEPLYGTPPYCAPRKPPLSSFPVKGPVSPSGSSSRKRLHPVRESIRIKEVKLVPQFRAPSKRARPVSAFAAASCKLPLSSSISLRPVTQKTRKEARPVARKSESRKRGARPASAFVPAPHEPPLSSFPVKGPVIESP